MTPEATSLHIAVTQFLTCKRAENCSTASVEWYEYMLSPFIHFAGRDRDVSTIRSSTITEFLVDQQNQGKSEATISGRYRALRAFSNWLETWDEAGNPPSPIGYGKRKKVNLPQVGTSEPRRATLTEVQRLLNSIPSNTWVELRDKAIIHLLFTTGIRRTELIRMATDELDYINGNTLIHGKGSKDRRVPLEFDTRFAIFCYLCSRPTYHGKELWVGAIGGFIRSKDTMPLISGPLGVSGPRYILRQRCEAANIRYLNPHSFRHGCATYMLNHGADMSFVQNLLGHTSPAITEKLYAKWLDEGMKNIHDRIWRITKCVG